jgi:K+-transporting ATPase A subunit
MEREKLKICQGMSVLQIVFIYAGDGTDNKIPVFRGVASTCLEKLGFWGDIVRQLVSVMAVVTAVRTWTFLWAGFARPQKCPNGSSC